MFCFPNLITCPWTTFSLAVISFWGIAFNHRSIACVIASKN